VGWLANVSPVLAFLIVLARRLSRRDHQASGRPLTRMAWTSSGVSFMVRTRSERFYRLSAKLGLFAASLKPALSQKFPQIVSIDSVP
jgi:hypothetical protein